jgi:hypothetical protein
VGGVCVDADQASDLDVEAGFFLDLTDSCLFDAFPDVMAASG